MHSFPMMPFSFDDDDSGFGEFKFASSSPTPQHHQQQQDPDGDEDDWSDFVQSPQTNSIPSAVGNKWEKPNGAIPLSIFGDQEEEEEPPSDPTQFLFINNNNNNNNNNNGFSPPPAKPFSRDVKDLISDLYGQPASSFSSSDSPQEKDSFDDGTNGCSLGFKDASSHKGVGDWIQAVDNRLKTMQDATDQLRFSNSGSEHNNMYAAHDRKTNGLNFNSDVAYSHFNPEKYRQPHCMNSENKFHPGLENEVESDDNKMSDFKDALLEVVVEPGSLGEQKTPAAEAEVFMLGNKVQGSGNMLASNLGDWHASRPAIGKEELSGSSRTLSGPLTELNSAQAGMMELKFHSVTALDDISSNTHNETNQSHDVYSIQHQGAHGPKLTVLSRHSAFSNNDNNSDDTARKFQRTLDPEVANLKSTCKTDRSFSHYSTQKSFLDLYNRLKEESLFFIVHHLADLKKSHEVAALSVEEAKTLKINEDIQAIYKVLQAANISENDYMGKHPSKGACVYQLVEVIKEPYFQALEEEYHLSERILSAEKELSASIELFEHASSVLHIWGLASKEEQQAYIFAWSQMALACTEDLQFGAMIWKESVDANISEEILSRGSRYFASLVEIYRVTKILRASLRLYKPWILSNLEDCSSEVVSCLEKCATSWTTSGLGKTLESISAGIKDCKIRTLVKPIKFLYELDELSFQNYVFHHGSVVCKLSLLPLEKLQDMKVVTWNGDNYCLTLANFWANRISCNPPKLPHIHAS